MEKDQKQQQKHNRHENNKAHTTPFIRGSYESEEIVPGIPIIRSNTPRPRAFDAMISSNGYIQKSQQGELGALARGFPTQAPSAPPLPEELEDDAVARAVSPGPVTDAIDAMDTGLAPALSGADQSTGGSDESMNGIPGISFTSSESEATRPPEAAQPGPTPMEEQTDFIWLFEYGLEMDAAILNSRERLNGHAYLQGPGVLKGYTLMLGAQRIHNTSGPTIIALVPSVDADQEVWGVLYRVPRRMMDSSQVEPSLLDTIHAAIVPQKFFEGVEVVVQNIQQNREVTSVTYIATNIARQQLQLVEPDQWDGDTQFLQRLVEIARQQKLPEDYIRRYLMPATTTTGRIPQVRREEADNSYAMPMSSLPGMYTSPLPLTNPGVSPMSPISSQKEQNTDSLPAFKDDVISSTQLAQRVTTQTRSQRWLTAFSLYLVGLLLLLLLLAVLQGAGVARGVFTGGFTPLGVPWQVIIYGLLGGCISCIVSLSSVRAYDPPLFVMITWFTRPFIGSILAVFSYILLTSGLFVPGGSVGRHPGFFWLAGTFAGLCEWWLFCRRKS